jgi:hypothetical protein
VHDLVGAAVDRQDAQNFSKPDAVPPGAQINGFNVPTKLIYGFVSADTMARRKANAWAENALDDQRRRAREQDPARRRCR